MDEEGLAGAEREPHLARGLEEGQALDVPDGPAYLTDNNIVTGFDGLERGLDHVGDMGDDLDGLAQVLALALFAYDGFIDLAGRPVVNPRRFRRCEPLVVAEVEIGLGAVVGDVDLPMLERAHRPRIDVEIGIEFLDGDAIAVALEEPADGGRRDAFAQAGNDAAGDKDILAHGPQTWMRCLRLYPAAAPHSSGERASSGASGGTRKAAGAERGGDQA